MVPRLCSSTATFFEAASARVPKIVFGSRYERRAKALVWPGSGDFGRFVVRKRRYRGLLP